MLTLLLSIIVGLAAILGIMALGLHFAYRPPRTPGNHTPADHDIPYQNLSLITPAGNRLSAWYLASSQDAPVIIILHGWGASSGLMLPLAVPLYRHGFNILMLDARNHGHSDSEGQSSLPRFAEDLHLAIEYLQTQAHMHNGQIILMGHSVGAGAVLYEASKRRDIAAVISLSAFAHPDWVMRRQLERFPLPGFVLTAILQYIQWIIGTSFSSIAPMNTACKVQCPVLLVHGDKDKMVPLSDAYAIQKNCRDKTLALLLIRGGGHNASNKIRHHIDDLLAFLREAGVIV